jgi:hypothetical protein
MGLFSVLIGLAVADVASSFHRLARSVPRPRWDVLTLATAGYALCMAVYMWFEIWGVRHFGATRHFLFYLALVAELFVLFLLAAASLPDAESAAVDLRAYYAANRRYFWSLVALFQLGYFAFGVYFVSSELGRLPPLERALLWAQMPAPFVIAVTLVIVKSRPAHYIGVALLYALMIWKYGSAQIN